MNKITVIGLCLIFTLLSCKKTLKKSNVLFYAIILSKLKLQIIMSGLLFCRVWVVMAVYKKVNIL